MSSLVRRIQKSIAKGQGFRRGPSVWNEEAGKFVPGPIVNTEGKPVGQHWPKVQAPNRIKIERLEA